MESDELNVKMPDQTTPRERHAALEARVAQLEGVVQALIVNARDLSSHQHSASGEVLVPHKTL